ncbi:MULTISPECIES: YfjI family protein [unclassified Halomonas]|uniref:YfjI family protein n=1 Tax=unclassified Halomonas TaxID=2609666 RepID=UPI0009904C02|nr:MULTISPECIES: YfjI family protein [unclassified Halomonas]AQU82453.1 hypothetical protein B2G49_07475 [Halomonas sp. 'Soap Lake \
MQTNINSEEEWPAFDEQSLFESMSSEVSQHVEVAPEMARTTALGAMAMACQGVVDVAFPNGHVVPTSLNLLTIAESGERKTALENWFFQPIRDFQSAQKKERQLSIQVYQRNLKNWRNAEKALEKKRTQTYLNGESIEEIERQQAELDDQKPQPSRLRQLIYENVTPSALAFSLYENIPLACLVSSEAGNIFEGRAFQDLPMFNSMWSGSTLDVSRRSSESFTLENPRLSLALMAQPKVIDRFLEKRGSEARDNGFLSRLIVIKPVSFIGNRKGGSSVDAKKSKEFSDRVTNLLTEAFAILDSKSRQRKVLRFSSSAKTLWQEIQLSIEQDMAEHGKYYHARDHASKLIDNVTRVAAILHTFEGYEGDIESHVLEYAYRLCKCHSNQYLKYLAGEPEIVTITNELIREIRRLGYPIGEEVFNFNKTLFLQNGRGKSRNRKKLDQGLQLLIKLGHVKCASHANFQFSEMIFYGVNSVLKNGIDYYIEELPSYESQYFSTGDTGRYPGTRINTSL